LGKKLGEGSFGQVRLAKNNQTQEIHAVKILHNVKKDETKPDKRLQQNAQEEADIWQKVGVHQNVVTLHRAYVGDLIAYFTMDVCECSLVEKLQNTLLSSEAEVSRVFNEMLQGILHLHELDIVHRDIKPDNFLIAKDKKTVKLTDFGLSASLPLKGSGKKGKLKGVYGTAPYMSPEMLGNTGCYDEATDIWSVGATIYVLLFGDFPYMPKQMTSAGMKQAILKDYPKPSYAADPNGWKPPGIAVDFVKTLLNRNVAERPDATRALNHPFVTVKAAATKKGVSLAPALSRVGERSKEFKVKIDPTVQRNLDELVELLNGCKGVRKSFSGSFETEKADKEDLPVRRNSRVSTHSGVLSGTLSPVDTCTPVTTLDSLPPFEPGSDDGKSDESQGSANPNQINFNTYYWDATAFNGDDQPLPTLEPASPPSMRRKMKLGNSQ
jgi:serine/threonine protein kinase